jgi:hypothetical protein
LHDRLGRPAHERDHRLAVEGAVRLGVVGVGVVAGKPEEQRRHAEGERDVARRGVLRLDEIHVLRGQRQRLPVEPALEQERPAQLEREEDRRRQPLIGEVLVRAEPGFDVGHALRRAASNHHARLLSVERRATRQSRAE